MFFTLKNMLLSFIQLFMVICFVGANVRMDLASKSFRSEFISSECNKLQHNSVSETTCIEKATLFSQSVKLYDYYTSVPKLDKKIEISLHDKNWKMFLEGNSLGWHTKEKLLQDYADDERVKTICEIGFNSGYSTLNFFISNRKARVISFDLFRHNYSAAASMALHEMFPERQLMTIAGSSHNSIPAFYNFMKSQQPENTANSIPLCQLIFIDGGHTKQIFLADLINMKSLADPAFHTLIIDDFNAPSVGETYWEEWERNPNLVENIELVEDIQLFNDITWAPAIDGSTVLFDLQRPWQEGGRNVTGSVMIAKYLF